VSGAAHPRATQAGFTLIEVMIALMIFGMIAAAGVALLAFSVRAQGATTTALEDVGDLNRLSAILTADLAQAQDRPTRDVAGALLPPFVGDAGSGIRLVRGGWSNPDDAPRAGLQKVEYRLAADGIERIAYPALDGAAPLPAALLLDHVMSVRWRYRYAGAWSDTWQGIPQATLPQAVELVATRDGGETYRLLFVVGTGAPRRSTATVGQAGPNPGGTAPADTPGSGDAPR
jgi:general secretion pathway protein J